MYKPAYTTQMRMNVSLTRQEKVGHPINIYLKSGRIIKRNQLVRKYALERHKLRFKLLYETVIDGYVSKTVGDWIFMGISFTLVSNVAKL